MNLSKTERLPSIVIFLFYIFFKYMENCLRYELYLKKDQFSKTNHHVILLSLQTLKNLDLKFYLALIRFVVTPRSIYIFLFQQNSYLPALRIQLDAFPYSDWHSVRDVLLLFSSNPLITQPVTIDRDSVQLITVSIFDDCFTICCAVSGL